MNNQLELTLTDCAIEFIYRRFKCISTLDYDGYIIDACDLFPKSFSFDQLKLLLDLDGHIKIIVNSKKLNRWQQRRLQKRFYKKLLYNNMLTLYDNPNEPFEEFSLRKNVPINYENVEIIENIRIFGDRR